jgi:hypothetical protein
MLEFTFQPTEIQPSGQYPDAMIRSRRITSALLDKWLLAQPIPSTGTSYRLRVWREDHATLPDIVQELREYVDEALDDARRRLRRGFEDDLSPFTDSPSDPAANYPALLHKITLFGYFGETLAVLAVEHWGAHGYTDWKVPAFLFRFHNQEFQHLEVINERIQSGEAHDPDRMTERRPGRTGDDGLAFRIDDKDTITDVLALEAKCLTRHSDSKVDEAHRKLSGAPIRPTGVRELINLLADYDSREADIWRQALLELWRDGYKTARRYDGVAYACNEVPRRPLSRLAWMPAHQPHASYAVNRNLEAMEFQFGQLDTIVNMLYRQP